MSTEGLWKPPGAEPRECFPRQAPDGSTASPVPIPTVVHSKGKEKGLHGTAVYACQNIPPPPCFPQQTWNN